MSRQLIFAMLTLVTILGLYSGCVMKENFSFNQPVGPAPASVPSTAKTNNF